MEEKRKAKTLIDVTDGHEAEKRESNFAFVCADADGGDHLFWLKINDDTSKSLLLLEHFQFILLSLFC
jgi:hypothetical protein